ncbi:MAG TPA: hypothetical protein PLQ76_02050 [bacterium]|nr:hypothetical protein [bacterium]
MIVAKAYKHLLTLYRDDIPVFEMPYQIVADGMVWFADKIEVDGLRIESSIGETRISDTISVQGPFIGVTRRWSLRGRFSARVLFSAFRQIRPMAWIVPGSVYLNGPSLMTLAEKIGPIREELTTIPCCSIIESPEWTFGIFSQASESLAELSTIATHISDDFCELNISAPGVAESSKYSKNRSVEQVEWDVDGQVTYERRFYIWSHPAQTGNWKDVLNSARGLLTFETGIPADRSDIVHAKARHLVENFFIERHDAIGFVDSVGPTMFPAKAVISCEGAGANIEAARAIYRIGRGTDDRRLKNIALNTADFFLSPSNSDEMNITGFHLSKRKWTRPSCDPQEFIQNVSEFIISTSLLHGNAAHDSNPRWLFTIRKIADNLIHRIFKSDSPSAGASPDVSESEAHKLAFAALAFMELYKSCKESKYLEAAEFICGRASTKLNTLFFTDDPETYIDRELAGAALRSLLLLHGATGRTEYIENAILIASYIESLTYCYNAILPDKTRLHHEAFRTCGGVLPHPGAPELDPLSIRLAFDFLSLAETIRDESYRKTAIDMIDFSCQIVTLSGPGPGLFHFMTGWQPPHFYHSGSSSSLEKWGSYQKKINLKTAAATLSAILDICESFPDAAPVSLYSIEQEHNFKRTVSELFFMFGSYIRFTP